MSGAEPFQHHLHRQDCCQRIRLLLSRVSWRAAMNRLKHRVFITDIAADRKPQSTRCGRSVVADDVPYKVWTNDYVIPFGVANLPLTEGIYISVVEGNIGELPLTDLAEHFAEETMCANDV